MHRLCLTPIHALLQLPPSFPAAPPLLHHPRGSLRSRTMGAALLTRGGARCGGMPEAVAEGAVPLAAVVKPPWGGGTPHAIAVRCMVGSCTCKQPLPLPGG